MEWDTFQSYNSSIKTRVSDTDTVDVYGGFQSYNSSIKTLSNPLVAVNYYAFQSYNSSIKTRDMFLQDRQG